MKSVEERRRDKESDFRSGAAPIPKVLLVVASPEGTAEFGYVDRVVRGLAVSHAGGFGVALPPGDPHAGRWREIGVSVHEIDLRGRSPLVARSLAGVLREGGYKVIHSHGRYAGVQARLAARLADRFAVHSFHGLRYEGMEARRRWVYGTIEKLMSGMAAYYVCLTNAEKEEAIRGGFGAAERVVVIPDGLEFDALDAIPAQPLPGHPDGVLAIGAAGRLASWRRPDLAARAFATLLDRGVDARFYWLDDGGLSHDEARGALDAALATHPKARERFQVVDARGRVEALIRSLDIVVSTSEREDFPWWPLVAMYAGRPTVLSRVAGNGDVGVDQRSTLYFDPSAPADLDRALKRLAEDRALGARIGEAARIRVRENFGANKLVEASANLYRRFGESGVKSQGAPVPTR